jgi:tetratricopeptide (TPR) repeat protein
MSSFIMAKSWKSLRIYMASLALGVAASVALGATLLVVQGLVSPAMAQEQSLSAKVALALQDAYTDIQNDDYASGLAKLNKLLAERGDKMSPYEKATVYEIRAGAKVAIDPPDYAGALLDLERAINTGALPPERTRVIRFGMAKLYMAEDRFGEAVVFLREYISWAQGAGIEIDADTWQLLAGALYQLERYSEARRPMENSLAALTTPKKNAYELMNAIYAQLGQAQARKRSDLLVKMINLWPENSSYWGQLAQVYQVQERDKEAAAVLESAYRAGLITDKNQIRTLIQYYNFLDTPYRGAKLLEKELARGTFERNIQNLELLAQLWSQAREQKKAIAVLEELAKIAPTGKFYYRLGQAFAADEQWNKAISNLREAINKGLNAKQTGDAWLLIGNALMSIDSDSRAQRDRAIKAFENATRYSSSRKTAQQWIDYIRQVNLVEKRIADQQKEIARLAREEALQNCRDLIEQSNLGAAIKPERLEQCNVMLREADMVQE